MKPPLHIRKLSKRWHQNTITGAYISQANLEAMLVREKLAKGDRDAQIRRARWDLERD